MRTLLAICFLLSLVVAHAQRNKYGLTPMMLPQYEMVVERDSSKQLVDLALTIPGIVLDIRYATENNFTKERIYTLSKAYARKPVAEALKRAQTEFATHGLGVKIFDAYRPYSATVKLYEVYRDTTYVASPYRGSRHNRGCALDMTLVDLKTGNELQMPTEFDSFQKAAWPSSPVANPLVRKNREMLIAIMNKYGFKVNSSEWWHFDFRGWEKFEVLDIDFEELEKQ